jgi:REP element-mobilizing transposase RayT
MSSTHLSLHYHIVFGTKHREPWIATPWRDRLHAYLGGIVRELDGVAESVGGMPDHVHLLLGLKSTHTLADVVRDVKRASSEWVHLNVPLPRFAWQEGYGAFTVSPSHREKVRTYIANQAEHHRKRTFRDEYITLLRKSGVEFEEQFLD